MCVPSAIRTVRAVRTDESPFPITVEREALDGIPNVYSHQTFFETDQAGFILRQWISSSLYDRIRCLTMLFILESVADLPRFSTRPFLSNIEKKWITFQILTGMQNAIERKACLPLNTCLPGIMIT